MKFKIQIIFLLTLILVTSTEVMAQDCYRNWYARTSCYTCNDITYNSSQTDSCSSKHPRQNAIKLCSSCQNKLSSHASYYKRGFSDYNCLAYALGYNGVQSWTWPASWGDGPTLATFKSYIAKKGYKYTTDTSKATGKNVFYVYVYNGKVAHFARKYTLDGKSVSGAKTISKWGACSLYTTDVINNPYKDAARYGTNKLICYK